MRKKEKNKEVLSGKLVRKKSPRSSLDRCSNFVCCCFFPHLRRKELDKGWCSNFHEILNITFFSKNSIRKEVDVFDYVKFIACCFL